MPKLTWKTCSIHGDEDPRAWGCPECVRELRDMNKRLRHAADTYMAAVVCYHGNPWDRVNMRKYAEAKERLSDLINAPPNPVVSRR